MPSRGLAIRPAFGLFSVWILIFTLVLLNGYGLSFAGLTPTATLIFVLCGLESVALIIWASHQDIRIIGEPLELAGFLFVVVGTWLYFIAPSWPTLLPPSYSGDAARHYGFINQIFLTGRIISDYPGGPALIAATLAQWIDWPPLRMLHPLGAFWIALTAGGIYGLACTMLPSGAVSKIVALLAPFALFITTDYFGGILIGAGYFWTQVASQYFIIGFVWLLVEHLRAPHAAWSIGMALCLIGISVSFQIWLALPIGLLGWAVLTRRNEPRVWAAAIIASGTLAAFWGISFITGGEFIPQLSRFGVEGAAVAAPSLGALGNAYLILPALGFVISLRLGRESWFAAALLILCVLQTITLEVGHLLIGIGSYWVSKSFFVWIFPLALLAALPVSIVVERITRLLRIGARASALAFVATGLLLGGIVFVDFPPTYLAPMNESEIQVALWARNHLDTRHVNYISHKGLVPQWLGVGLWGESFPDDLWVDFAQIGPKTFEEWRDDPSWGEYLFVASDQHFPLGRDLQIVYQRGDSMIVEKSAVNGRAANLPAPAGQFGDVVKLIDYDLPNRIFHAGEVITFSAQIETGYVPAHQVVWRLQLRDLDHNSAAEARIDPFDDKFPLQRWPDGRVLAQPFALPLPFDTRAGLYDLELGLYYVGNGAPLSYRSVDGATDDVISLGQIKVELPHPTTHQLGSVTRLGFLVGDAFSLVGYRLPAKSPIQPGESLKVYLYWQSNAPSPRDFTAFVHLLDAGGVLRAQSDAAPRNGTYPTSIWKPGEIIMDSRTLTLPPDAPPGEYHLEVGMYEWPSLERLPVSDAQNRAQGDHAILPDSIRVVK